MPYALFSTVLGTCGVAWNQIGLTGFQLPEANEERTAEEIAAKGADGRQQSPPPEVQSVIEAVQRHFQGDLRDFTGIPLDWSRVSEFQRRVYFETQAIKPGFKRSYGDIARALALEPAASRAVGVALGANPWPLLVPCHRVVSRTNKMTGFSAPGGVRTKTRLLALEGAELLSE